MAGHPTLPPLQTTPRLGIRTVLLPLLSFFLLCLSAYVIVPMIPLYVERRFGASIVEAAWITVGASALGVIPSALLGGWLADRIGDRLTVAVALLGFGVTKFLFPFARSMQMLFWLRAIGGVYAAAYPATQSMLLRSAGTAQDRIQRMTWYGAAFGGGLTLGPILGGMVTHLGGLNQAFNLTFYLSLVGALLVLFAREERQTAPRPSRLLAVPPHPAFWRAAATALLVMGTFGTLLTVIPLEERSAVHLPAPAIGVLVALLTGSFALGPLLLAKTLPQRQLPPATAMALCLAGDVAAAAAGGNPWILAVALLVLGTGLGIAYVNVSA